MESAKQRENKKMSEEILNLLSKPTAKVSFSNVHNNNVVIWVHGLVVILSFLDIYHFTAVLYKHVLDSMFI